MNEVWEKTRKSISQRIGVGSEQLTMDQGGQFREKIEALHVLNSATPIESKMTSPSCWKMTLRGGSTTFVPIGNIFSGLFCEIKNTPPATIESIRRPTKAKNSPNNRNTGLSWRTSESFRRRFHELRARIAEVRPHEIVHTDALQVVGQDLFDLRLESNHNFSIFLSQKRSLGGFFRNTA